MLTTVNQDCFRKVLRLVEACGAKEIIAAVYGEGLCGTMAASKDLEEGQDLIDLALELATTRVVA